MQETYPMRLHFLLAATLAFLTFAPALQAQKVSGGPDPNRKASTVVVSTDTFATLAAVSISYTPASWRDSYNDMLEKIKGSNYMRLGNGWWASLETVGPLEIGGTKVEAGCYYLGLVVARDGSFSLLLFDSRQAMKAGLLPHSTALYRGDFKAETKAPLTPAMDSLKEVAVQMEIEITADKKDPSAGRFAIRWGKHELSAPVKFHLIGARDAAAPRK